MAAKMSLAQVSDVIFLLLLPLFLKRFGYRRTLFLGILAWIARYFALSASADSSGMPVLLIYTAILLHGVSYDFLFIAGQLYVDEEANAPFTSGTLRLVGTRRTATYVASDRKL